MGAPLTEPVFAGFDPGITSPAVAAVRPKTQGYELLAVATMRTKPADALPVRLQDIWYPLGQLLRECHPMWLAIEEQSRAQVAAYRRGEFNADNSKTIWTCGLALGCALAYGVIPILIPPQTAKIAVLGKGAANADKKAVRTRVLALTGSNNLNLDASDAVALAIAAAQRYSALRHDKGLARVL